VTPVTILSDESSEDPDGLSVGAAASRQRALLAHGRAIQIHEEAALLHERAAEIHARAGQEQRAARERSAAASEHERAFTERRREASVTGTAPSDGSGPPPVAAVDLPLHE
jgi:hypothetical protein